MIEAKNLYKEFDGQTVLKGVDVTFKASETSLIIGHSGAGKTVLMKTLLGLHRPERGIILFSGRERAKLSVKEKQKLQQEIGMVFQGNALFDSMTIEENLLFPLKMFTNQPLTECLERVNFVLKRVNLENVNEKFPAQLSGGMQKRVALARGIVMQPKYLFCDEPNSGLDPETSVVIDNLIAEITQEYNITTIINTHDMNSVLEIGQQIVFIKDGAKIWEGSNKEIETTSDQMVRNFIIRNRN